MDFDFEYLIELFFSGLTRGSIYALIALGYTMVYGIIGLINFAHGEIYMLGAFTAFIIATVLSIYGFPLFAVLILAAVAAMIWLLPTDTPWRNWPTGLCVMRPGYPP